MAYHPIENLLPKSGGSIYRLVRMAAKRALELSEGKPPLVKNANLDKVTTTALDEIVQGKIGYKQSSNGKAHKAAGADKEKE